jgi:hypothetical protein
MCRRCPKKVTTVVAGVDHALGPDETIVTIVGIDTNGKRQVEHIRVPAEGIKYESKHAYKSYKIHCQGSFPQRHANVSMGVAES